MSRVIKPDDIAENVFKLLDQEWMLITAGVPEDHNTMTASWGGMGVLWGKRVCWCVIRPQRHTLPYMEREARFTLSFFDRKYRPALDFCGSKSGKDVPNKAKAAGLTPEPGSLPGTTQFAEARLVLTCRKLYTHDIDPTHFVDPSIDSFYPTKDYHRLFLGEIEVVAIEE